MPLSEYVRSLGEEETTLYLEKLELLGFCQEDDDPYLVHDTDDRGSNDNLGNWSISVESWPEVEFGNVYVYLLDGPGYTQKSLQSYKSLDAYKHFVNGCVHHLCIRHSSTGHCIIRGRVERRLHDVQEDPHKAWVGFNTADGNIISGHCTCMTGDSTAPICMHIAAILFKVEAVVRLGYKEKAGSLCPCQRDIQTVHEIKQQQKTMWQKNLATAISITDIRMEQNASLGTDNEQTQRDSVETLSGSEVEKTPPDKELREVDTFTKDIEKAEEQPEQQVKTKVSNKSRDDPDIQEDPNDFPSCSICQLIFTSNLLLEDHMEKQHGRDGSKLMFENGNSSRQNELEIPTETVTISGRKSLPCQVCGKCFRNTSDLNRHVRIHTGEKPFSCNYCGKKFSESGSLYRHMRIHTGEKPYVCKECGKSFSDSSHLRIHMKGHSDGTLFTCSECDKCFSSAHFKRHMRKHKEEKSLEVSDCDMHPDKEQQDNARDPNSVGENGNGSSINGEEISPEKLSTLVRGKVQCNVCSKYFRNGSDLNRHVRVHTGEKPYMCNVCGKRFAETGSLYRHMRMHTGEKPYVCKECGKRFGENSHLRAHSKIHTREKPFKCHECDKCFISSAHQKLHMRTHTGERPHVCRECDKSFSTNSYLQIHMRKHTGERPYLCSQCAKSFSNSSDLCRHMRTHILERPYSCGVCSKRFIDSRCLHKHMRKHTEDRPFGCSVCEKRFFQKSDLRSHTRIHTGEKPFKCDVCGKGFAQSGDCHRHMRIHTGERPFKCGECDKSFCDNSSYRKHIKRHVGRDKSGK